MIHSFQSYCVLTQIPDSRSLVQSCGHFCCLSLRPVSACATLLTIFQPTRPFCSLPPLQGQWPILARSCGRMQARSAELADFGPSVFLSSHIHLYNFHSFPLSFPYSLSVREQQCFVCSMHITTVSAFLWLGGIGFVLGGYLSYLFF